MAIGFKKGKGGMKEYKPSTLPPQVISLSVKGKWLAAENQIEVNVLFNNIPQGSLPYLNNYIVAYDKDRIPNTPFEGKQEIIPKTTSGTVSHTFRLSTDYLGNVGFRVFPKNSDNMYQTVLFPNINSVMAKFATFEKPKYTGQHIFGSDDTYEWIKCLSSGKLTLSNSTYDVFAVGHGGAGAKYKKGYDRVYGGGGGGGGYAVTLKSQNLEGNYDVIIPATLTPTTIGNILSANAGLDGVSSGKGGNGGSGGGGGAAVDQGRFNRSGGNGGSDGSNGGSNGYTSGGTGQGTSTRAFAETAGELYSSGGAGAGARSNGDGGFDEASAGSAGAGGRGANSGAGGTDGGVGQTGIVIVRWRK